jgi:nicotinate-nucleotide pyrophosphorylase (carboxylating)
MTPDPGDLDRVVRAALEEDLRYGPDVTTAAVIPPGTTSVADVVARQPGTLAGLPVAAAVLDAACPPVTFTPQARDGDRVAAGDVVARVEGPLAEILTAERTLLNFLTHLSGIATATRAWVDAIDGTGAFVRDTRKTVPGLRALEKYAVRCGGGVNHRMGLGDAALIKDNHIAAAGGITAAFRAVLAAAPGMVVEVECDTLDQVGEALAAGAALILLDNMSPDQMRSAVAMARVRPAAKLEASGGLRLENAREVASTGVHYLSVGALTHSSPALDLALDVGLSGVSRAPVRKLPVISGLLGCRKAAGGGRARRPARARRSPRSQAGPRRRTPAASPAGDPCRPPQRPRSAAADQGTGQGWSRMREGASAATVDAVGERRPITIDHVAAYDPRVKAVVSQVGAMDLYLITRAAVGEKQFAELEQMTVQERVRHATEGGEVYIPDIALPGQGFALQSDQDSWDFAQEAQATGAPSWRNQVTMSSFEPILEHAPARSVELIAPRPLLMILAKDDTISSSDLIRAAFERAGEPKRLLEVEGGHYSVYPWSKGQSSDQAGKATVAWFTEHLLAPT